MSTTIVWFRQDLRLTDNPALNAAIQAGGPILPLFIESHSEPLPWRDGSATRWWLHHSLKVLSIALEQCGSRLILRRGPAMQALRAVIRESRADAVFWNRLYEPAHIARDQALEAELKQQGLTVRSFNSALLQEPWEILTHSGEPYRMFTPYWKALQRAGLEYPVSEAPAVLPSLPSGLPSISIGTLGLLPKIPRDAGFYEAWIPGEQGAHSQLQRFLDEAIADYRERRDLPARSGTSRLSPHLHFGELSPRQVTAAVLAMLRHFSTRCPEHEAYAYLRQIGWREFAYHLLYHFPATPEQPLDSRFREFPWAGGSADQLKAWQAGATGYPWVDAGMRELSQTGWMHNRVRMAVASFLTKNLRIPWQHGARWFWDTLVDADLANNTLGWQWTAGCGADAAPYFRIFNPVLQGQRFDPTGDYIRRWIPELSGLPAAYIHQPWNAPLSVLASADLELGTTYPWPIVNLKQSREAALAAFASTIRRGKPYKS